MASALLPAVLLAAVDVVVRWAVVRLLVPMVVAVVVSVLWL